MSHAGREGTPRIAPQGFFRSMRERSSPAISGRNNERERSYEEIRCKKGKKCQENESGRDNCQYCPGKQKLPECSNTHASKDKTP